MLRISPLQEKLDDGTTLAVVLINGNEIITGNVGDSEIVLCRGPSLFTPSITSTTTAPHPHHPT